jgi:thiol-disulfide isomerase/thioredoxin
MTDWLTRRTLLAATGAAALAGCVSDDSGGNSGSNGAPTDEEPEGGVTGESQDRPTWQTTTLEDTTTGETFTIAEFDTPVVLHTFATWCSTCERQQNNIDNLQERRDDVAFVDLTIDENDNGDDVASHAQNKGFEWRFGVSPADVTSGLVDDFGQSVTVAPQSPVIVVCPDGGAHKVGKVVSADDIEAAINASCG